MKDEIFYHTTKPFSGFGWIETSLRFEQIMFLDTTKPFSGFGWIETFSPSILSSFFYTTTKPFSGFGWIETG